MAPRQPRRPKPEPKKPDPKRCDWVSRYQMFSEQCPRAASSWARSWERDKNGKYRIYSRCNGHPFGPHFLESSLEMTQEELFCFEILET
jgi:hypothetical protein